MMNHLTQWKQLQSAFRHQRIAQAMLFVGPLHCALSEFVIQLMQLILCKDKANEPCMHCTDCQMIHRMEHPDVEWVKPDKNGGVIKIDQIRDLQYSAYLTPQRSQHRIIAIEAAERMNIASANALLKILEEPAKHTIFILIAQQLSSVLPTILSRCQITSFAAGDDSFRTNLLKLGEQYPPDSDRFLIIQQAEIILDGLIALLERKEHPCTLAAQWNQYELSTMLWFLYLVYSQLQFISNSIPFTSGPGRNQLIQLSTLIDPILIFNQIDKINSLLKKISHNMNVNHTLVLEDLLCSLVSGD